MSGPLDIIVPTTVVVTVWMVLHATNIQDIVQGDVTRDILMMTVRKSVHTDSLDLTAANVVSDTV